ncbi:MAG: hypothetical protein PVS3B3_33280 [Ktedonobacteraceae bacterium]
MAYLRNGTAEVVRTVVFDLIQMGHLQVQTDKNSITQSASPPRPGTLWPLEQDVYAWFNLPREASAVFLESSELVRQVEHHCKPYCTTLESKGMVGLLVLIFLIRLSRLTDHGKQYLQRVQLVFGSIREQVTQGKLDQKDSRYMLAVALFGVTLLAQIHLTLLG